MYRITNKLSAKMILSLTKVFPEFPKKEIEIKPRTHVIVSQEVLDAVKSTALLTSLLYVEKLN